MRFITFLLWTLFIALMPANADFSYTKPRRIFTKKFVAFCICVAVFELLVLNDLYTR